MERIIETIPLKPNENAHRMMFEQNSWINFTVLDLGAGYKVKRIEVLPLKHLSFKKNKFYKEYWTVVQGTAKITVNDRTFSAIAGRTIEIGIGDLHRVENPDNSEILVFINVQCGICLTEDDFIRFSDGTNKFGEISQ